MDWIIPIPDRKPHCRLRLAVLFALSAARLRDLFYLESESDIVYMHGRSSGTPVCINRLIRLTVNIKGG